ncbi:MAG TPA: GntR family transcriptional regulator [Bradyrhizobium sp.]|nr:GntR family transcriptional regulator [Bradyrhizobium sp.]
MPLYVQLASVMRQRIETGHWSEGDKISTIEELESEFGVARVTVRQAIEMLREEGLLDAQQGRGTFVSGKPKDKHWLNLANDFESIVDSLKNNVIKRVHVQENADPPELRNGEGQLASGYAFLRSVQYNNDEPFSVVNLHLARHIFNKDRKRFMHTAALSKIIEMEDLSIVHAYQVVTIGVADPETAELLKIGLGEPTADCRLVLVDSDGIAVYVANIHYHRSCFAVRVDLLERSGRKRSGAKS